MPYPVSLPDRVFLRSKELVEGILIQESGLEQRRTEAHQVFRRGEKAAARPLVAVVDVRSIFRCAVFLAVIKAGTLLCDRAVLIGSSVDQTKGRENVALHVGQEVFAGRGFDDRAQEIEAVTRIIESSARRSNERIVFKDFQSVEDGVVMLRDQRLTASSKKISFGTR